MKKIICLLAVICGTQVLAQTQQDAELLSAQVAYQQALDYYQGQTGNLAKLQEQVQTAKAQYESAKVAYEKAQQELAQAQANQQQANTVLQTAGERLNRAWVSARGAVPR